MAERRRSHTSTAASPGAEPRAAAARALHAVLDRGQSLTRVLQADRTPRSAADQALVQEMVYGALRLLPRLRLIAGRLLERPLKPRDGDLQALILIGLYQLGFMKTPSHAAVSATVEATRLLGKPRMAGLINALLRRFQREHEALPAWIDTQPESRWLFPDWLLERLRADWPDDWESIVSVCNERAPMALRVNPLRGTRADALAELEAAGIGAQAIDGLDTGVLLDQPCAMRELPGFDTGRVSIQDSGAQLAARLLDAQPGERVLDACAAPGGKTAAILERAGNALDLVAIDSDAVRLATVGTTLDRLGLSAQVLVGDAADPHGDWTARPFDRILLDVPCSATGVIRRHPDIKWLRRPEDIRALAATQSRILDAIWPLLRPGGRLLYATCSLLAEENEHQVDAFLARRADARVLDPATDWGRPRPPGRQLLPTTQGHDGFFYALLAKDAP
ncbi:16S rRNA (cytosine(967)-C(5))-methyltransferase RsmB [Allochromatium tepidum]|uniref:16S rRNA (cytosine(967)-C(5))-methyltransferase n=1 Tax=Allochromatium tepidum TaxID=553982 RepID=A0ABN6G9F4_9GAMM|nr:16S rRNA (cytosine(967)-C(5))-methyltransferase RsmB [Allochromatium tepidum]BCU06547.1 ribosomal RNA small subunit methyltransferase B [Allochromatium tepidum]